jgi:O-antigen/teichoic acid export membrane protein
MSDTATGMRSALKLGVSLVLSWSVALSVRVFLPRQLGPEVFGQLNFADAFSTAWFVALFLGVDTYVRKEVPLRPQHASDFLGGVVLLRLVAGVALWLTMMGILWATHRPDMVLLLVTIFSAAQLVMAHNMTLAALLQSVHRIDAVAVWSVVVKLVWGALVAVGILVGHGAVGAAVGMLVSELLRAWALQRACNRHLALQWRVEPAATRRMLQLSLPFFVTAVAATLMGKLDVTLLGYLSSEEEVGWYSAGQAIASLSLLLTPVISWVLLPLSSHAAARSTAELGELMRRALEMVLQLAIPTVLFLALFADTITLILFGPEFAPTAISMRVLSSMFVLTYITSVSASFLVRLDKGWLVTRSNLWGLLANVVLNLVLIPLVGPWFGRGGAGLAAAVAAMASEALVVGLMFLALRGENFDARSLRSLSRTLLGAALLVGLHVLLEKLGLAWPWRLVVELAAYPLLVMRLGAVDPADVKALLGTLRSQRT